MLIIFYAQWAFSITDSSAEHHYMVQIRICWQWRYSNKLWIYGASL